MKRPQGTQCNVAIKRQALDQAADEIPVLQVALGMLLTLSLSGHFHVSNEKQKPVTLQPDDVNIK